MSGTVGERLVWTRSLQTANDALGWLPDHTLLKDIHSESFSAMR